MKIDESKILKTMIKTYRDEYDDVLEDYILICAVLGLLKAHDTPEYGETVRLLQRRQNKITDKMKSIQENLGKAQEELKALEGEEQNENR